MIPPSDVLALLEVLDALGPEARRELLRRYCPHCGEIQGDEVCQCTNEE